MSIERLSGPQTHICWTPDAKLENERELVSLVREKDLAELEQVIPKVGQLIRLLASHNPIVDTKEGFCMFCYEDNATRRISSHDVDCPWVEARELLGDKLPE
jgi:hypothetical protein